jgi:D-xylose transport system substrate-binding protein
VNDRQLLLVVALALVAGVAGLVIGLASCNGDDSAAPPTGSTVGTPEGRAPFLALLLPAETDGTALDEALSEAGIDHSVDTAEDAQAQVQQAQDALPRASAILVAPVDAFAGAGIVQAAKDAGVSVVQYDRFPSAGPLPDYFTGYDQEAIGRMEGEGLIRCLGEQGVVDGSVITVNGPPGDPTADALDQGFRAVLQTKPFVELGRVHAPVWTAEAARPEVGDLLDSGEVDGVLATSDAYAAGVIAELRARKLDGVPVTGSGASVGAIQEILAGNQCMTVYAPVMPEAQAAARFAAGIAQGVVPDLQDSVLVGDRRVPAVLSQPVEITDDVQLLNDTVIRDGAMKWDEICSRAYERFCPPASQRGGG